MAAVVGNGGTAAPARAKQGNNTPPTVSTKCRWCITPYLAAAEHFLATKGTVTDVQNCFRAASNTPQETRPITLPAGTRQLFVCVNNDNYTTDATATLSVSALVQACQ